MLTKLRRRIVKKYRIIYKRGPSTLAMFFAGMAISSWLGVLLLSGYPLFQYVYYTLVPSTSSKLSAVLGKAETSHSETKWVKEGEAISLPPLDISLPGGHYLMIPSIGVDAVIWEAPGSDYERALRRGVWRVPEFGGPDTQGTMILAAHRFGYLEWTQEYRRVNSFFNLPKIEEGSEIEILWDQRLYKYRVTRLTESEEIDDYESDLILYTCKFLVSPVRIIVYAERV